MARDNKKLVHPNSRKARKEMGKLSRAARLEKQKIKTHKKQKTETSKIYWFKERLQSDKMVYTFEEFKELVDTYVNRLQQELTELENKPGNKKGSKDISISFVLEQERTKYKTQGIMVPDFLTEDGVKAMKQWDGEQANVSRIPLIKFKPT